VDKWPWTTILAGVIVTIVALFGGIAVVGESLDFQDYASTLSDLAIGVGLVAVGRGINKAGKHISKEDVNR
jgi:hypothetical protein